MAANSNAQAVAFANNRVRPMADQMYRLYLTCKNFVEQWNAQGISAVIPSDANLIADGSASDGRAPMTDAQANIIFAHATNLIAYFEGASGAPTNNASMQNLNQIVAVQVNGTAVF